MSFYADCARLSSSKPSRQPLSQVKPAVTSAEARPVAWLVRQCQQRLFTFYSFDKIMLEPKGFGYSAPHYHFSLSFTTSAYQVTEAKNIRCAWKGLVSSHFLLFHTHLTSEAQPSCPSGAPVGLGLGLGL